MKRNAETVLKRKNRRESYAKRTARLMAMMARDGEAEELAEMIAEIVAPEPETVPETAAAEAAEELAETVAEVLETGEAAAPAEPVAVEVPENHEITIDCGAEILSLLQQIVALMQGAAEAGPGTDCGGSAPTRDEEPEDPVAEALAEAVLEEISPAEPMETLVAEVIEEALEEDPAAALGEAVEAALTGAEADPAEGLTRADADPDTGLIEPEEAAENARTADALRAAMATFRPILKTMAPAARRQAVRKIADSLKTRNRASDRKAVGYGPKGPELNAYGLLKGAARRSPAAADHELGRRIMEQRNANLRKRA